MSHPPASPPDRPAPGAGGPAPRGEWRGLKLLEFQIRAIQALESGANVLVSAPTGAGKTLVAEYAIADAVARGRRCVYTAPIKALSNQKYRDFRDDPAIDVGLMTGDVTIQPSAQVLIMTTEILRNAILENPAGLADVDFVILDEVHYMDDPERGSVWEESLIFAPEPIRFVALSATIHNLDQLGSWMREIRRHELVVIESKRRPVPLQHRLWSAATGFLDPARLEWARKRKGRQPAKPRRGRGRDGPPGRNESTRAMAPLFAELADDALLPALVFSFSRKDCERLALSNRRRDLLSDAEHARMEALQADLIRLFQLSPGELDGEVFGLARRGVGYHHAGMLPIHKEVVERMFTSGLIKLLFTTETFALGINMPARTVVFASLRKFDGVGFDYLRTRDYMQMAGRAGRQGIDTKGLVVCFLDERDFSDAPIQRMIQGRPEPVESRFRLSYATLLHLVEHLGRERIAEAWERSFNQYQHRGRSKKARERNSRVQRALVDAHLDLLLELGYVGADWRLSPRGRVARLLYGYELQLTEMLFRGVLEALPPKALAVVFVALVHESRRRGERPQLPPRSYANLRRQIEGLLGELSSVEARHGIPMPLKPMDWGLSVAVERWFEGAEFEALEETYEGTPGDLVRTLRMALQLLRQVRRTLDRRDEFADRLQEAIERLNREEVDARRQLELG